jgi:hypothetical protein
LPWLPHTGAPDLTPRLIEGLRVTVQGAGEGELVSALSDDTVVALLEEAEEACQKSEKRRVKKARKKGEAGRKTQ